MQFSDCRILQGSVATWLGYVGTGNDSLL